MSDGYSFEAGAFKPKGYEYIANFGPAGSLAATATDMARFMIAHLQQGALGDARILKPETVQRHARARLQPPPRRERVRPRLLRDVHERPADHRARRRHELLPHRARAARGGGRRLLRLASTRAARRHSCPGTSCAPSWTTTSRRSCPRSSPRPTSARGPPSTPDTTARSAIPTPASRRSSPCWEGPPSPRPRTTRSSSPDCSGTSPSTSRWRPAVFREVDGDRTVAFVEDGKRPGRGDGRPVRLHPLLQAALVRRLALPLHAARALRPALRDRRGLGAATLEERQGGTASRRAGRAATSARSAPSTWSSSSAFASILAAGLDELIFAVPKGLYAVLTLPLDRAACSPRSPWSWPCGSGGRAYWTRASRLLPHRGRGGGDRLRVVPELLEPAGLPDRIEPRSPHFRFRARRVRARLAPRRVRALPRTSADPTRYSFSVCRRRASARLGAISAHASTIAFSRAMGATYEPLNVAPAVEATK